MAPTAPHLSPRCSLMYHQIILRAFESLHGMSKKRKNEDESCAITEFMKDTCPETFQKVLRVRAAKTMEFFSNDETLPKLFYRHFQSPQWRNWWFSSCSGKKQMPTWEQWTPQWWLWPIQSLHLPAKLFELCVGTWPPVRSFPATLILFPSWKLLSVSQLGFVCPVLYTAKLQACFWKLEFSFFKIWNIDLCLGQGKLLVYVWFLPCGSRGLPRGIPADFMNSVFWSLTTAVGQLHQRLVSTYEGPQMNHSWPTTCVQWL